MLKKRMLILFLAFFALACVTAAAQEVPHGKWWKNPEIVKELELTRDQIAQLERAYDNSRRQLIKRKSRMETEQFELQNLFDQRNIDENAVKNQYMNVENARKDLGSGQFEYIMEVRRIIGYEKYNRLTHGNLKGKGKPKKK